MAGGYGTADEEEGASLVAPKPNYSVLGFTIAEGALFGIPLGCIGFRNVLVANGAFAAWCRDDEATTCHAQEVAIAQFTQFIVVSSALGNLLIEPLIGVMGANGTARLLILCFGLGFAVCGVDLRAGWSYVVGMTMLSVAGGAMFNLNFGTYFVSATPGASAAVSNFWMTMLNVSVDIGYFLAVVAAGIAGWSVLPLAWWFVVFGAVAWVFLTVWFERSVKYRSPGTEDAGAAGDGADQAPDQPKPFLWLLKNRDFIVATMQFTWSLIFFSSVEAASARIARFFALSPDASFYTPIAISGGGLFILFWANSPWNDVARVSGAMRIAVSGLVALLFGVPAFRHPVTFFAGFAVGGAWRSTSMAASIHNVYILGAGGTETRAFALMLALSTGFGLVIGQPVTHLVGLSPLALSLVIMVAPLGAFACEVLPSRRPEVAAA